MQVGFEEDRGASAVLECQAPSGGKRHRRDTREEEHRTRDTRGETPEEGGRQGEGGKEDYCPDLSSLILAPLYLI